MGTDESVDNFFLMELSSTEKKYSTCNLYTDAKLQLRFSSDESISYLFPELAANSFVSN